MSATSNTRSFSSKLLKLLTPQACKSCRVSVVSQVIGIFFQLVLGNTYTMSQEFKMCTFAFLD